MKDPLSADQDYLLWVSFNMTSDALLKARQKELNQYNISNRHAMALFVIQAIGDKATPAEISRWSFRESHSVSDLLNRMEKEGLVKKVKNLDRKNLVRVTLTEKGRQVYNKSVKRESIHRVMSALSEEERQQLGVYLEKLRDIALKELRIGYKPPFPPSINECAP